MGKDEIRKSIMEIIEAINKTKKIEFNIPENLRTIKFDGCEEHTEKLQEFLNSMKEKDNKPKETSVAKKSNGRLPFYFKLFAGIGFTGFAGFLLYYVVKRKY